MKENRPLTRLLTAALPLALTAGLTVACGTDVAAEEAQGAEAPREGQSVMATVGEATITTAEVEEAVSAQLADLERQRHEALEQGLERLIEEKLLELEAGKRGMSSSELLQAEVGDKVDAVTDEEVDSFYTENQARIRQPKEAVAEQIRQFLVQQRETALRTELMAGLRTSYEVSSKLEPLRIDVETAGHPFKGGADAPVEIVEFSDFECPFCSRVVPTLEQINERYGDKVKIVFRQFPLDNLHPNARKAAEASLCAEEQGKFWEMHDSLFANQRQLAVADLKRQAKELELDTAAFDECLDSGRHADQVQADLEAGAAAGVSGTPAFLINGRFLSGAQPFEAFEKVIEDELSRSGG